MDLIEEEGSVASGNNDVREEGSVASRNNDIREEGSVDLSNNNNRGARENLAQSENATPASERQENQQLHQEEQITPKLPVDQLAIPKRVTFTPGPLDSTMEGRGQSSGCDEQQDRLATLTSKGPSCSHKHRFLKTREMGWISNRGSDSSKTH